VTWLASSAGADAIAIEAVDSAWSYGDLERAADDLATALVAGALRPTGFATAGVPRRRRVVHAFDLSPEGILAVHGIARSGAILAPAHMGWSRSQETRHLESIQPDAILVSAGVERVGDWHRRPLELCGFGPIDLLTRPEPPEETRAEPPAATDVVLSTSGTGGRPRLACHSWAGLSVNAAAANRRTDFGARDAWLATLAWAHIGGLAIIVRAAKAGARIICGPHAFNADGVAMALDRHDITHVSLVPVMLERLLDLGCGVPPTLRCALIGGGPASDVLIERARDAGWPVSFTYGLTEAGSQVATTPPGASSGAGARPLDGFEVRIADDGEIEVRGSALMLGYLESPGSLDPEGWFATGDLGALDETGRLRVTGRRSDRIVTGGTNVDPIEIEALLLEHPGILRACVVGTPDARWGEVVTAVVIPHEPDPTLESQLDAWARERVTGPRLPRRWRFVDDLPQTPSGKVDRSAVRTAASREND